MAIYNSIHRTVASVVAGITSATGCAVSQTDLQNHFLFPLLVGACTYVVTQALHGIAIWVWNNVKEKSSNANKPNKHYSESAN